MNAPLITQLSVNHGVGVFKQKYTREHCFVEYSSTSTVQHLEISRVQSLEISRFCTLEISRRCTVEVDE